MRITKLVHSCLLVETDSVTALFDPGSFSKEAVLNQLQQLDKLDYLVITHNHQDHLDEELVAEIVKRWPNVKLAANDEIRRQLAPFNLVDTDDACSEFGAPHEAVPTGSQVPNNSGWHFGDFSHPGDSFSFNETRKVLALPYVSPWGSTTRAVGLAKELKPEYIVPVHDWHLNDEARDWYRGLLKRSLDDVARVVDMSKGTVEL